VALEDEGPPPIGTDVGVGVIGLETSSLDPNRQYALTFKLRTYRD
jgi:hypothetical protein